MSAAVHEFQLRAHDLWMEFQMAREKHHASRRFEDGVAESRAYAAFMREYLDPDFKEFLEIREGKQ